MKIIIFGGTTEGRILAGRLAGEGCEITVSVATEVGQEELKREGKQMRILTGRLGIDGMEKVISFYDVCIDATHPYALDVTANIKEACARTGKEYIRLLRDAGRSTYTGRDTYADALELEKYPNQVRSDIKEVGDAREACRILLGTEGNILLTTGSKDLGAYAEIPRDRLYVRVLPVLPSLEACVRAGIPSRNIIAMFGPFTQNMNEATLRQYQIAHLVTKETGKNGGFLEKMEAVRALGISTVVIRRPEEKGLSMDEVFELLRERVKEKI